MRNLLEIETGFLSLDVVKEGLQLNEINTINRSIATSERKSFARKIELGHLYQKGLDWFNLPETKTLFANEGISWTAKEFPKKAFDISHSQFRKVIKASNWTTEIRESFSVCVKLLTRRGFVVHSSIENLNKFGERMQVLELAETTDSEILLSALTPEETETTQNSVVNDTNTDLEGDDTTENNVETNETDTVLTLSFKPSMGEGVDTINVSVRYSLSEGLITTNSGDEIRTAVNFLLEQVSANIDNQNQ